jgi:hypothetical protein
VVFLNRKNSEPLEVLIDTEDLSIVDSLPGTWCAVWSKNVGSFYARMNPVKGMTSKVQMHRLIMGEPEGLVVDHENHDTLDNRRSCNIRIVHNDENAQNKKINKNNTSGERGITWIKRDKKWQATVRVNGKLKSAGYFSNKDDAIRAVRELRQQLQPYSTI